MEVNYQKIGDRIRQARKKQGLSQEKLADLVDLSKPHMSHIETGSTKVSLPTLIKIANSLHCTLDQLVMDSLEASSPLYLHTISQALKGCTQEELGIAEDVLKALLSSLRARAPKEF